MVNRFRKKIPFLILFSISSPLLASNDGLYVGIDFGRGYFSNGGNVGSTKSERHESSFGLNLGYHYDENLKWEAAYHYLGNPFAEYSVGEVDASFHQGQVIAKYGFPQGEFYPYFKTGVSVWWGESHGLNTASSNGFSPVFAGGLTYSLNDKFKLKGEYQFTPSIGSTGMGHADHHMFVAGVIWELSKPKKEVAGDIQTEIIRPVTFVINEYESQTLFGHDSSELLYTSSLDKVIGFLSNNVDTKATITGHTDSDGSEKHNQGLSEKRATKVFDYMTSNGIEPERIQVIGLGETSPIADNSTAEGKAMNRRVEIFVESRSKLEENVSK
ncbi:TPA: OmpA family protein [Vibrio campbellii]